MRISGRRREQQLPGLRGTARVERRAGDLLGRLQPGDVAVMDHTDLDRATADGLVRAGVVAVLNAAPMMSGRYPSLGPRVLVDAGVTVLDGLGPTLLTAVRDGVPVRLHDGLVHVGDATIEGRTVDADLLDEQATQARTGLSAQLETLTHNATEFLRREEDLLLHGRGLPTLTVSMRRRTVAVVVDGPSLDTELARVRDFLREQEPVVVAVDGAAPALLAAGVKPAVLVVDTRDGAEPPPVAVLEAAKQVVVVVRGAGEPTELEQRLGRRAARVETSAQAEDAALLLADAGGAALVVGVGVHATLEDFLDRQRGGLASTYLTRLKLGPRLVDAEAVPRLYSGRVRPWHLLAVMLAGLVALVAAVSTTPVGSGWSEQWLDWGETAWDGLVAAWDWLSSAVSSLVDRVTG
ncbi:putative cytokinetic ring protein SteA [Nocardioides bruguierae]|uniref:putative cytokinetic ring protein SteA n=1 Tax=Nocardioides bruguierae TaxID=2945102 RepID=UPI002021076D|nr:putative cytokinetic ring protein SteA [Nocardioides bruguierae]MCL8026071.1 putative cytokinetic ring protein SteA [Nocardioides bruguierae]